MLSEGREELRRDQEVVGRDLRFGRQGGKLHGYPLAIAIRIIEQCSRGGVIEKIVVAVSGNAIGAGSEIS